MVLDPLLGVTDLSVLKDLPAPSTAGLKDRYQIWEYQSAWKKTGFLAYKIAVGKAEVKDGAEGKGYVTLASLAEQLTTQAWASLSDAGSELSLIVLSDAFKDLAAGQTGD